MPPTALPADMPAVQHASHSCPLISLQRGLCTCVCLCYRQQQECLGDSCDTLFLMPSVSQEGKAFLFHAKAQDIALMVEILLPCSSPGHVQLFIIKDGQSPAQPVSPLWPVLDWRLSKSLLEKGELGGCAQPCVCVVSPPPVPRRCLARGVEKMLNVPTAAAALSAGCSLVMLSWRPGCLCPSTSLGRLLQ